MHTHPTPIPYSEVRNSQLPSGPPIYYFEHTQRHITTATSYCNVIDWLTFELRSGVITVESCGA